VSPPVPVAVLIERMENLKRELDEKHSQNRRDIHLLRNKQQEILDAVWLIKLKLALWSGGGGVLTAGAIELLRHLWK
jgi:hypothetical protein